MSEDDIDVDVEQQLGGKNCLSSSGYLGASCPHTRQCNITVRPLLSSFLQLPGRQNTCFRSVPAARRIRVQPPASAPQPTT